MTPSRARAGTSVARVFASFLTLVLDSSLLSITRSAPVEPRIATTHRTRYGSPDRKAWGELFYIEALILESLPCFSDHS